MLNSVFCLPYFFSGMPCAAQYTIDNKWYRAKIVDLPGNKMVEVFYVDYGNQEVLPCINSKWKTIANTRTNCALCTFRRRVLR
jgi:hypothetical protein